uniref:N-terminal Xaa-Pro-Lys N-methyltransferase 1 n=1 Tax=Myotis myotis TaxID=51298 RepID=A0A7J7UQ63_MYOMY|nr:N-terminal Xaa-Pro-Lys N-methyltransferase 1 [Myotis myotis]
MSNCRHTDPRRTGPAPQAARRRRRRHCGAAADAVGDSMASKVIEDEKQFYSKAKAYWKDVPPTVDGMLGGYGHISSIDINSSRKFLQRFLRVGGSGVLRSMCWRPSDSATAGPAVSVYRPGPKDSGQLWTGPRGDPAGAGCYAGGSLSQN